MNKTRCEKGMKTIRMFAFWTSSSEEPRPRPGSGPPWRTCFTFHELQLAVLLSQFHGSVLQSLPSLFLSNLCSVSKEFILIMLIDPFFYDDVLRILIEAVSTSI